MPKALTSGKRCGIAVFGTCLAFSVGHGPSAVKGLGNNFRDVAGLGLASASLGRDGEPGMAALNGCTYQRLDGKEKKAMFYVRVGGTWVGLV